MQLFFFQYVPVCIASSDDRSTITAEPAVVVAASAAAAARARGRLLGLWLARVVR